MRIFKLKVAVLFDGVKNMPGNDHAHIQDRQ